MNEKVRFLAGLRAHAPRLGGGAHRHAREGAGDRHGGRDRGDHRAVALHRPLLRHHPADDDRPRRLGGAERRAQDGDPGDGLRPGHRRGDLASRTGSREAGGQVVEALRVPLQNPDFAPFLQRARDAAPEALFAFVPSGVGSVLMRQFAERGLNTSGIRLIALGDVTDDDILNGMGEPALGVVTAHLLLGRARQPGEPEVRGGLPPADERRAAELHGRRRLRRHDPDLQSDRGRGRGGRRRRSWSRR